MRKILQAVFAVSLGVLVLGPTAHADPSPDDKTSHELRRGSWSPIENWLETLEKSVEENVCALSGKRTRTAGCRWVRECTYIYCCKWGPPPGGRGTAVCVKQCCDAYETVLRCD